MRVDHTQSQVLLPHHPPHHHGAGDFLETGNHSMNVKDTVYHLLQAEHPEDANSGNRDMGPIRIGSKVDGFERKGQAWFVATELQSDLVVEVGEMSFHLHKFPLLSRSGKLNRLVFDSRDTESSHIKLLDMPGGPETFELAAKFCYGVPVELTATNVAALRCAAEYLDMTEELDEGNLVSKTEAFLSFVVLASWKDSVTVLHSCEKLLPWAEELQVVRRCCESLAWKACTDASGMRWSVTERTEQKKAAVHVNPLWDGPKQQHHGAGSMSSDHVPGDWWFEDVSVVCVEFFSKIIHAIKVKGMRHDLIGSAVVHYAVKWLPSLTNSLMIIGGEKHSSAFDGKALMPSSGGGGDYSAHSTAVIHDKEHSRSNVGSMVARNRGMIETLFGILPVQKDAVPCTFLLRFLRLAKMFVVSPTIMEELEKRAGMQLDQGTMSDLLIPNYDRTTSETFFDIDLVQRLLDCFLLQDIISPSESQSPVESEANNISSLNPIVKPIQAAPHSVYTAKMRVAKLIDNYLVEVGRDQHLSVQKFLSLAEALPEHTRVTDDGLYKAIDTYLRAHPSVSEHERKRLCRTLDCQRLSLDACMHAAQNERLPLRVVVQVLFGEQIKLRNAVTGTSTVSKGQAQPGTGPLPAEEDQLSIGGGSLESIRSFDRDRDRDHDNDPDHSEEEIKVLRSDVERMKGKFMALQHDYTAIQAQLEKLTKHPKSGSGWKKLFPHAHLPHPHFHMPHFLTHPLDMFHHHHDGHDPHHAKHHHEKHGHDSHHRHHGHDSHNHRHGHDDSHHHRHGHGHDSEHHHGHHREKDHGHHNHAEKDHGQNHSEKDHWHQHSGKSHGHHRHGEKGHEYEDHFNHHREKEQESSHRSNHDLRDHPESPDHHHQSHHRKTTKDHHCHDHRLHPEKDHDAYGHHTSHTRKTHESHHETDHELHLQQKSHDSHHETDNRHEPHRHNHGHHVMEPSQTHHHPDAERQAYNLTLSSHMTKFRHSEDDNDDVSSLYYSIEASQHSMKTPHHVPKAVEHRMHSHQTGVRHSKDKPPHPSESRVDSGEDSSRSLEGPATPTHTAEQHKKHYAKPFSIAIRKWRNSIS